MRILVLGDEAPDLANIERALRSGAVEIAFNEIAGAFPDEPYAFGGWTLDPATRELTGADGERAALTSLEFALLLALIRAAGRPLSRAELARELRGRDWSYFDRSLDTLVARLRKKLARPGAAPLIRSVRGVGYVFCARVARRSAIAAA